MKNKQYKFGQAAPYNPRKISKEQLASLHKSMKEFGDLGGIIINRRTGNMVGGHQRIKGITSAVIKKKPFIDKTGTIARGYIRMDYGDFDYREVDWPIEKEQAANIAANRQGGKFDDKKLKALLKELDGKFDLSLTGFIPDELSRLLGTAGISEEASVPMPLPTVPVAKSGDLYILGTHRLLCGDAADPLVLARLTNGTLANMVFTDPPYGVAIGAKNRLLQTFRKGGNNTDIVNDSLSVKDLFDLLVRVFSHVELLMAADASFYVTAPQGGELGKMMLYVLADSGLPVRHVLIWVKNQASFSLGRLDYDYQHEPILYGWKDKHNFYGNGQFKTSIWPIDKPTSSKEHPTMKPIALVENAILNSTKPEDIVLDVFGGSGTTLIACEATKRRCFMMELEPRYVDVIIDRWEKVTGNKAIKDNK